VPAAEPTVADAHEVLPAAHVVFPRIRVAIRQVGREPVLADPTLVIFYNPGQRFFRTLRDARGDHCYFVEVEPDAWAALTGDEDETEWAFAFGPSDPAVYMLQHTAIAHLREQRYDPLVVEENLAEAVAQAVADARVFHGRRPRPRRRSTSAAHRGLLDEAKELLGERLALGEIVSALCTSKYHLTRVFRAATGFSLHGYRNQLRLWVALVAGIALSPLVVLAGLLWLILRSRSRRLEARLLQQARPSSAPAPATERR
jgi:AraC-like DNA-binding protein